MIVAVATADALDYARAWEIVGGLSTPRKMPGWSYGLPAAECKTGSMLRKVPNSVCSKCYAFKGNYAWPKVKSVQYRRLEAIGHPRWTEAMIFLLHTLDCAHFRWHDSGDIQHPRHLENIVAVAQACPHIRFWLPTREKIFVYSHLKRHGAFPENLVVRLSAAMIDGAPPEGFPHTSTVVTSDASCPAPKQDGRCGTCRACWDPKIANVSYLKH